MLICRALKTLSFNLRRLREARGLTQEKLAERSRLAVRHYQQIEGDQRPGLQVATVERLAKALNVEIGELFIPRPNIRTRE